jgi:copper(I)-binding protein
VTVRPARFSPRLIAAPVIAVALSFGVAGCGDDSDDDVSSQAVTSAVTVTDAWVREPAAGQTNAAGYGTIINATGAAITLIGATAALTATVELHETMMDDEGVMSMQERDSGFVIADGETFTLEPGGPHLMMVGVDPAEISGDVDLTFVFDGADPVTVTAELRAIAGDAMEDMDEMEDGEMEDGDG